MKKYLSKFSMVILLLVISVACRKDNVTLMPDELAELKSFYARNMPTAKSIFKNTSPNWSKISSVKPDDLTVYEITLNNPDRVGLMSNTSKTKDLDKFEQTHALKLLLFVNEQGKVEKGCYMLIEASTAAELINVHYKRAGNLNGNVVYYNLNGAMSNGVAYVNGKAKRRISYLSESEIMAIKRGDDSRMTQGCSMFYIETGYMGCIYDYCTWYSTGYVGFPICGNGGGQHPENDVEEGFEGGISNYSESTVSAALIKEIKVDTTVRPCVDIIASIVISKAAQIQNVLSDMLTLANVNASASITTMANSSTYKIKIGEHLFNDLTKYNADGSSSLIRTNGITNDTTGYIYLNKLMINDGTDLAIAATLIHELMHSYMVYGIHHTSGVEKDIFRDMNTFLFDQSGTAFTNQGIPQHIQMANTYVDSMASLLTSYAISRGILVSPDSSISLNEYCKDIFWQNLQHSQAYFAAPNKSRSMNNGEREYKNTFNSTKKKKC
ncbi:MAG: hypothetical protein REI64_06390 [Pedobacter sp.]|nr:hypothetical protein [Pedobacter sp.]